MLHRKGRLHRLSVTRGSHHGIRVLLAVLGAMVLVACAPAADSPGWLSAPQVELEVRVATNCEASVDVAIEVDETTFTFADLELAGQADSELPISGAVRVPWSPGVPYRVTMRVGCDDTRRMEITTYRVEGDVRTILAKTTTMARGVATSAGSM